MSPETTLLEVQTRKESDNKLEAAGGLLKARELFGNELEPLINELNGYLIA